MNKEEQIKFIEENYPFSSGVHSNRRVRQDFFSEIKIELQAYILGLYASDGSIDEKRKTFRIHMQECDSDLIYLIKDIIAPDSRMWTLENRTCINPRNWIEYKCHNSLGIDINSSKICTDLVNLGIGYNKTYSENHIPNMDEDLIRHFIRGYFDGDGSIIGSYVKPDLKWKKNENFRTYVSICCKTKTMLEDIQYYLNKHNINSRLGYYKRDDMYDIRIPKTQLSKLYNLFYKDSNFYMMRKHNKFYHYVNTEVTQLIAEYRNAQEMNDSNSNNSPTSVEHPNGMKMCAELIGNYEN